MKRTSKLFLAVLICLAAATVCFAAPSAVKVFDTALEDGAQFVSDDGAELSENVKGNGTQTTPYVITTAEEFNSLAKLVNTNNAAYVGAYYQLGNNIDFTGKKLVPFGTVTYAEDGSTIPDISFKGVFDGNGYSIFGIDIIDADSVGVIGCITQGDVKDLSVTYNISENKDFSNLKIFGGIIGYAYADTQNPITVSNCDTNGNIKLKVLTSIYAGGIVGRAYANRGNVIFKNCVSHSDLDVSAVDGSTAGGFVGNARASSSKYFQFDHCISYGNVTLITAGNRNDCGGFVGYTVKDDPGWLEASLSEAVYHYNKCFAAGDVYTSCGGRTARIGGFIGKANYKDNITFCDNRRKQGQSVVGVAKFTELDETVIESPDLFNREALSSSSFGFDLENDWYFGLKDSRLYLRATAKKNDAAALRDGASIRLSSYNPGLRFVADIEMYKRDYIAEYGFILTTENHLGDNELTFDYGGKYVSGVAYDENIDIFLDKTDETVSFTGVLYNIPKAAYNEKVVARTYIKYNCNGRTYIIYGNAVSAGMSEIASEIEYNNLNEEQREVFEKMFPEYIA